MLPQAFVASLRLHVTLRSSPPNLTISAPQISYPNKYHSTVTALVIKMAPWTDASVFQCMFWLDWLGIFQEWHQYSGWVHISYTFPAKCTRSHLQMDHWLPVWERSANEISKVCLWHPDNQNLITPKLYSFSPTLLPIYLQLHLMSSICQTTELYGWKNPH